MEEFQTIAINLLKEAPYNPRRRFSERGMEDLTDSVRKHGVLVPLLVRPVNKHYEIVAGSRRYRAAKAADLTGIPARVKQMEEAEALELSIMENLQREDVHPLEEALGYQALKEKSGYDVPAIAAKVSRSEGYVYQRIKLLDLIEPAQKAFLKDDITAGHAILIARLQPKEQEQAFKYCKERSSFDHVGTGQLKNWIERTVLLDLHAAPFKKDDPELVPAAGACMPCKKRTGSDSLLFSDFKKKDTCTDPACYQAKIRAHIDTIKAKMEAKGEKLIEISTSYYRPHGGKAKKGDPVYEKDYTLVSRKNRCDSTRKAIAVDGYRDVGKVVDICMDPKCKKHYDRSGYRMDPREKARRKAEELKKKKDKALRSRLLTEILARIPRDLARVDLEMIALSFSREMQGDDMKLVCQRHSWEPEKNQWGGTSYRDAVNQKKLATLSDHEITRLLLELCLTCGASYQNAEKLKLLQDTARRFDIDPAAVEKAVAFEFEQKAKPKAKAKPRAKKKSAKKKEA